MAKQAQQTSAFNPEVFLSQEVTGANETKFTPPPEGDYKSFIDDIASGGDYEGQPIINVTHKLLDDTGKLAELMGLAEPTIRDSIFLDIDNSGQLAFGPNKNVKLGKYREAAGQNDPKMKWNFNMLRGVGPLVISVIHTWKNGEGPYAKITKVVKAS